MSSSQKLNPTVHQATSRNGVYVVLKMIRDFSERRLLEYLNDIKAPLIESYDPIA